MVTSVPRTVQRIERGHPETVGVEREVLDAYVDALAERRDYDFEADEFRSSFESLVVDGETWADEDAIYRLGDDRVSRYPLRWHEELGDSDDVAAYVSFLEDTGFAETIGSSGAGEGIDEDALLDVVATVGRIPRSDAKSNLEALRQEGVIVEDADQHPHAGVYLSDEASDLRDPSLDS